MGQKKAVVERDICDYVKKYWRLLVMSAAAAAVCYGFLVFSGNIRIDTEELLNQPGSKLGWLTIGRFSLALLKDALGLASHSVLKSGILFFLFFLLGANLLTFAIWRFSGRQEYPYWIFLMLYVTSNIWSYQVYFSVQQAEVACAMFLVVIAAIWSTEACFKAHSAAVCVRQLLLSGVLLVLGLGAYQALAAYYIAVCIVFFLALLDGRQRMEAAAEHVRRTAEEVRAGRKAYVRRTIYGIIGLLLLFCAAYISYSVIAQTWFMTTADYMEDQLGWGRYAVTDCIKNVLRTAKNLLLGIGPRNFSFYGAGTLVCVVLLAAEWKKRDSLFWLKAAAVFGLIVSPFLMTAYMGEMLVTRSQFALPVAAAFLGMYAGCGLQRRGLRVKSSLQKPVNNAGKTAGRAAHTKWACAAERVYMTLAAAAIICQCMYNLRLAYTDNMRFLSDAALTEQLVEALQEANDGEVPKQPVIFVGYQEAELPDLCRRTEMYGWSFYGWDYSKENPTGATHRIVGFIQAHTGEILAETADTAKKQQAVKQAEELLEFPEEGSIAVTDSFVVVKLSDVKERMPVDWW